MGCVPLFNPSEANLYVPVHRDYRVVLKQGQARAGGRHWLQKGARDLFRMMEVF
jgi:hypothetical protein